MVTRIRSGSPDPWPWVRPSLGLLCDGFLMLDREGRVLFLNPAGRALLGFGEGAVPDVDRWGSFLEPAEASKPLPFERALRGADLREEPVRIRRSGSPPGWLSFNASPLRDEAGVLHGALLRFRDVTEEQVRRTAAALEMERRRFQRAALLQLLRADRTARGLEDLVRVSGRTLGVARCGLWLLSGEGSRLRCAALYDEAGGAAGDEPELEAARHPAYLAAASEREGAPIEDAASDPRARELRRSYLQPRGIGALLDAPIYLEGRLRGILCHEHIGGPRRWEEDERTFALSVAAACARTLGDQERRVLGAELEERNERLARIEERGTTGTRFSRLAARSASMTETLKRLRLAAGSDVALLLRGESGTGKELAARAVHEHSSRKERPFVAVNCAALPEALLESELFGHVKGAFTGAEADRPGLFRQAHRGTLFLDEIGEMPRPLQAKLLRALQQREVRPVGGGASVPVDFRLICATHRPLEEDVAAGRFREDLLYRVRVFEVLLPPLRERPEDLPGLLDCLLRELSAETGRRILGLDPDAYRLVQQYSWPGNIRELRNALEHAFVTCDGDRIRPRDLPSLRPVAPEAPSSSPGERERLLDALRAEGGHRARAARRLGVSRVTLWHRLKAHGIDARMLKR